MLVAPGVVVALLVVCAQDEEDVAKVEEAVPAIEAENGIWPHGCMPAKSHSQSCDLVKLLIWT